jgi:hypothetical protein
MGWNSSLVPWNPHSSLLVTTLPSQQNCWCDMLFNARETLDETFIETGLIKVFGSAAWAQVELCSPIRFRALVSTLRLLESPELYYFKYPLSFETNNMFITLHCFLKAWYINVSLVLWQFDMAMALHNHYSLVKRLGVSLWKEWWLPACCRSFAWR